VCSSSLGEKTEKQKGNKVNHKKLQATGVRASSEKKKTRRKLEGPYEGGGGQGELAVIIV